MKKDPIIESCGNVFTDLGFSPEMSTKLTMRADLMVRIREIVAENKWTQREAAEILGITQSRVSDLVCGKWEKFSLDMLITLVTRAGKHVELSVV